MKKHILIGELLVQSSIVHKKQVAEALMLQKNTKKRIGEILLKLGYIDSRILARKLSEQAGIRFMKLQPKILNRDLIKIFPYRLLYEQHILPLYEIDNNLHVATGDPANHEIINRLQEFTKKQIVLCGAEPIQITKLLVKV